MTPERPDRPSPGLPGTGCPSSGLTDSGHLRGIAIAVAGILVLSPDSLLVRLVQADGWTLLFWRGALLAGTLGIFLLLRYRGQLPQAVRRIGRAGFLAGTIAGVGTVSFVFALLHTTVANTLIIIGISPLVAALLGRTFLGEPVHRHTWVAIPCALVGVVVAASGSVAGGPALGDLFAAFTACCVAANLTALRAAGPADMTPSVAWSGVVAALIAAPLASPLAVAGDDVLVLGILGLIVLPVSFALIALAPRHLPAHEVSLILLLEMVVGPYWVWLALGERPGLQAVLGGAIVLATLVGHSIAGVLGDRRRQAQAKGLIPLTRP
jgi:drug/metabolite transporter (DMT)-like permease